MLRKCGLDLLHLLLDGRAHEEGISFSTTEIARKLGISQQSASRWLIELERDGLIERRLGKLRLTDKALHLLSSEYLLLKSALEPAKLSKISFKGKATSGLKDGKYYLSLPEYRETLRKKLGFAPFPGTLNVEIEDPHKKLRLMNMPGIPIDGFFSKGRFFGSAKCFRATLNGKIPGAIIMPKRSHYGPEIVEFISEHHIRKELRLKDGDAVSVEVK